LQMSSSEQRVAMNLPQTRRCLGRTAATLFVRFANRAVVSCALWAASVSLAHAGPAALLSPAPGSTFPGSSVTFTWSAGTGAIQYWLNVGSTVNGVDFYSASQGTALSQTIGGLPTDGRTIYVRLWTLGGGTWVFTDYTFTAATLTAQGATLTNPSPGSTLTGATVTFTWSAGTGAIQYWLNIGSTANGVDLYSASQGTAFSQTVGGLPTDGRTIYVRLWTQLSGGTWVFTDYTFTAVTLTAQGATLTNPSPGSTLTGATVTFTWSAGAGAIQYWLNIGSTANGVDLYSASQGTAFSQTIGGLPTDGRTIYVRLWTQLSGGTWVFTDYTFTAVTLTAQGATLTNPSPGSTLTGATVTFTWSAGAGAIQYWLNIGSTANGVDLYSASQGTAFSQTIGGLPTDGRTIYVRLWTQFSGGTWVFTDYTFTAITDVRGMYTLSASITQSACSTPSDNGTFGATGNLNLPNQIGGSFSGTATLNSLVGGILFQQTISLSGTIGIQGQFSGSFTFTTTLSGSVVSSGDGTFSGSLSGNTVNVSITGQIRVGESCLLGGTLMGTR